MYLKIPSFSCCALKINRHYLVMEVRLHQTTISKIDDFAILTYSIQTLIPWNVSPFGVVVIVHVHKYTQDYVLFK